MLCEIWQEKTLAQLRDCLQSFDTVQAILLVGSLANDAIQIDFWSDIDLVVVVADLAIDQFYPDTDWLKSIHPVFTSSHSQDLERYTLRVCFTDMRRVDFIFLPASALDDPTDWASNRFQAGFQVLFSRPLKVDAELPGYQFAEETGDDPDTQF